MTSPNVFFLRECLLIIFTHFQEFKMLLLKVLVLIAVLLPMVISTADVGNWKKRAVSYAVEGCFSEFPGASVSRSMGGHNSNVRCQDTCRDKGYILAATKGDQCQCGNIYSGGKKVDDSKCTGSFDHKGWSTCNNGYYMTGLHRSSGHNLYNIEES